MLPGPLLHFDFGTLIFELCFHCCRFVLGDAGLDGARSCVHQILRFLQAEAGDGTDDLDHLDLLLARSGEDDVERRLLLDLGRSSADLSARAHAYTLADQRLAALLPAIPLYQQVIVNTYSSSLYGIAQNDQIADFDTAAWYCAGGNCAG